MTADEIAEVCAAGLVVENDNEPLPEDAAPPPANELPRLIGEWILPAICPRAEDGFSMNKGKFKDKTWDSIAAMNELQLWSMCFPIKYLAEVVVPETNKHLKQSQVELTMSDFLKFLGFNFFMVFSKASLTKGYGGPTMQLACSKVHRLDYMNTCQKIALMILCRHFDTQT